MRCLDLSGSRLVSADFAGFVRVWNIVDSGGGAGGTGELEEVLRHRSLLAHRSHVTAVWADATRVVTGSRDRTALVMDFAVAEGGAEEERTTGEEAAGRRKRRSYYY